MEKMQGFQENTEQLLEQPNAQLHIQTKQESTKAHSSKITLSYYNTTVYNTVTKKKAFSFHDSFPEFSLLYYKPLSSFGIW